MWRENPSISTRRRADIEMKLHIFLQFKPALLRFDKNGFLLIVFIAETENKNIVKTKINVKNNISWSVSTGIVSTHDVWKFYIITLTSYYKFKNEKRMETRNREPFTFPSELSGTYQKTKQHHTLDHLRLF